MTKKFPEYKQFDLSKINQEVLRLWREEETFRKSISTREGMFRLLYFTKVRRRPTASRASTM